MTKPKSPRKSKEKDTPTQAGSRRTPKPSKPKAKSTSAPPPLVNPFSTPPVATLLPPGPLPNSTLVTSAREGAKWRIRQQFRKSSCSLKGHGRIRNVEGVGKLCERCGDWVTLDADSRFDKIPLNSDSHLDWERFDADSR